ncbi:hypothetical protein GE115_03185 [Agromyces sp. CFH 90414]|uniref:Uncharacterized protein n=1 Tax=Agromyces agglutinans TaxID=2662258 RepID=A0A6I2F575_9MICO|nr:hypothetical protein [Agromyces agglutinans]MRG58877.1 hypothetical protein [Agromyces agglutinans]
MGASEISVQPDQVFAELVAVLNSLHEMPDPAAVSRTDGAAASESPAAQEFRRALNGLGIQLGRTVRATVEYMAELSDQIRAAVKQQVELDASFADEAKTITGVLDSLDDYFPDIVQKKAPTVGGRDIAPI